MVTVSLFIIFTLGLFFGLGFFNIAHASTSITGDYTGYTLETCHQQTSKLFYNHLKSLGLDAASYNYVSLSDSSHFWDSFGFDFGGYMYAIPKSSGLNVTYNSGTKFYSIKIPSDSYLVYYSYTASTGILHIDNPIKQTSSINLGLYRDYLDGKFTMQSLWATSSTIKPHTGKIDYYVLYPNVNDDIGSDFPQVGEDVDFSKNNLYTTYIKNTPMPETSCRYYFTLQGEQQTILEVILNGKKLVNKDDFVKLDIGTTNIGMHNGKLVSYGGGEFTVGNLVKGTNELSLRIYNESGQTTDLKKMIIYYEPTSGGGSSGGIDKPNLDDYPDGIGGFLKYMLDTILYYLTLPFKMVANFIKSIVSVGSDFINQTDGIGQFISGLFSSFPDWIVTPIKLVFSISVLMIIISLIRR